MYDRTGEIKILVCQIERMSYLMLNYARASNLQEIARVPA